MNLYIILKDKHFNYVYAFMQQKKHLINLISDIYEAKNTTMLAFISTSYPEVNK